jgi:hypothetical protein
VAPLLPPDFRIAIAGRLPEGLIAPDPRLNLLGRVPDAIDFARTCRVMALTSRAGTGIQLKTLECFELGLPAVATASSLRGISERPAGLHIADEPAAFAQSLVELVGLVQAGQLPREAGDAFIAARKALRREAVDAAIARLL